VKMSSLGDVVHTLPALSDAAAAFGPALSVDWVVEEAFAAVPARHPAVTRVLPVAWRRWRSSLAASRGELAAFRRNLRRNRYDLVLDAQGLIKSAVVTALARAEVKAGLSRTSAREGAAALCYGHRVVVAREGHAVHRTRALFAQAFGYPIPTGPPDFGIAPASGATPLYGRQPGSSPRCVLLHGTTWDSKHWPERFWCDLARRAAAAGFEVVIPWGDEKERVRAQRVAADSGAVVLDRMPLAELTEELSRAALVVGVDSGLAHLAGALEVPTLVIYGATSSALTGCLGRRVRNLQAEFPCAPCLSRACGYRGPVQRWQGEAVEPACYAAVAPEGVWSAAMELTNADRILHL